MSRETLKDFLNSIGKSDNKIGLSYDNSEVRIESGVDLGTDPVTKEQLLDLDNEKVGLLGDYLSYIVENSSNIFKIDSGNERATASRRGESLVLPEEQGASNIFVSQGTEAASNLNSFSDSGKFENISNILDKTGKEKHAHFLYKDIVGRPGSTTNNTLINQAGEDNNVVQGSSDILSKYNRFANITNKKPFSDINKPISEIDSDDSLHFSNKFGKADLENNISLNQLKEVGKRLLYKASGFDNSSSPGEAISPEEIDAKIKNNEQIGNNFNSAGYNKKNRENTRPKNAYGAPTDNLGNSIRSNVGAYEKLDPNAKNSKSFGTLYNPSFKFTTSNPKYHKLQAAIAAKVLCQISKDFMATITDIVKSNDLKELQKAETVKKESTDRSAGPYIKGVYDRIVSFDLDLLKKLIFVKTTFPYPDCFEKGIEVFFGDNVEDIDKISKSKLVSDSPGYWLAVASSTLKTFDQVLNEINQINEIEGSVSSKINTIVQILQTNKIIDFANAAATVGDIYYKTNNGLKKGKPNKRPFDVDNIKSSPGTNIGKSKDEDGRLVWRQSSATSAYLLPRNIIRAGIKLNNITRGAYPARGMLGSQLIESTYLDRKHDGSFNRIPEDIIKNLEDKLEGEYVPFYIQDLRTNEIISFHAFLTQLSDTISPSFSDTPGYGRLDSVKTYSGTKRSLQVGFILYATSKEDYDMMWYKINKLTTLLYPQWTQGTKVSGLGVGDSFIQPYSQVLGASPLVRLRVGDIIKSNYSKFNLARLFGIGDPDVNPVNDDFPFASVRATLENVLNIAQNLALEAFYGFYGSVLQYIPQKSGIGVNSLLAKASNAGLKYIRTILSETNGSQKNGFANPFAVKLLINKLEEPKNIFDEEVGYKKDELIKVKPNLSKGYKCEDDGEIYYFDRLINGKIVERVYQFDKVLYKVLITDLTEGKNLFNKKLFVNHSNILPDYRDIFLNLGGKGPLGGPLFQYIEPRSLLDNHIENSVSELGIPLANLSLETSDLIGPESERFMLAENNPFVRAYESTKGRGLAGTMGSINFNWLDEAFTWDTDYNSRAPKGVAISFNFDVIHDISPGLDHSGYNRAPLYNVGNIMKEVSGDPHEDVLSAENGFKKNKVNFKTGE